jgi:hypothetical protein
MFATDKPMPTAAACRPLSYRSLLADFGNQLGKKMRLDANLKLLERHGFITAAARTSPKAAAGPAAGLRPLAPRILDGALADVLARADPPAPPGRSWPPANNKTATT